MCLLLSNILLALDTGLAISGARVCNYKHIIGAFSQHSYSKSSRFAHVLKLRVSMKSTAAAVSTGDGIFENTAHAAGVISSALGCDRLQNERRKESEFI